MGKTQPAKPSNPDEKSSTRSGVNKSSARMLREASKGGESHADHLARIRRTRKVNSWDDLNFIQGVRPSSSETGDAARKAVLRTGGGRIDPDRNQYTESGDDDTAMSVDEQPSVADDNTATNTSKSGSKALSELAEKALANLTLNQGERAERSSEDDDNASEASTVHLTRIDEEN